MDSHFSWNSQNTDYTDLLQQLDNNQKNIK